MVDKLNAAETRFRTIADTVNEVIITSDGRGAIVYVNCAAAEEFGYSTEEVQAVSLDRLIFTGAGKSLLDEFRSGPSQWRTLEACGMRADGSRFPIELSHAHWVSEGEPRFTVIARDITERKNVDRMKDEFISTVSHELRTPLTSIKGSLRLVESGVAGSLNEQCGNLLKIGSNNVDRLARLISDILNIERIESGALAFDMKQMDILSLVRESIDENRALGNGCGVTFALRHSGTARVRVDSDRFRQVMANLVGNAAQFSPRGTTVHVDIFVRGGRVRVAVVDRGRGIPEAFRDRIFSKFAQADGSDTRDKGGTGLGLSIVKSLVERFGGEVGYETEVGRDTTFYFELPALPATEAQAAIEAGIA